MNDNLKPKGQWGGAREGAGRKLQPSTKALRKMKRYLDLCYVKDFQLMARLACRPEEFGEQVQFAGKEEDSIDKSGKQSQSRSGGYQLDPVFKAQLDLLKFRCQKFLPDAPKEVEVSGEMDVTHNGLPTPSLVNLIQNVNILLQNNNTSSEIPSTSASPSAPQIPTSNGNENSSQISKLLTETVRLTSQSSPETLPSQL